AEIARDGEQADEELRVGRELPHREPEEAEPLPEQRVGDERGAHDLLSPLERRHHVGPVVLVDGRVLEGDALGGSLVVEEAEGHGDRVHDWTLTRHGWSGACGSAPSCVTQARTLSASAAEGAARRDSSNMLTARAASPFRA